MSEDEKNSAISRIMDETNKFLSKMVYLINGRKIQFRTVVWQENKNDE